MSERIGDMLRVKSIQPWYDLEHVVIICWEGQR